MTLDGLARVVELHEWFESRGRTCHIDEFGTFFIEHDVFNIFVTERPGYCDRGRWLLHVESERPDIATVDAADRFPRYYFFTDTLMKELDRWLEIRERNIAKKHGTLPR